MSGALARFRGRWRVALRYGWRDARRHKGRTALVAVMVALPVAVGSFATSTLWSVRETPQTIARSVLGPVMQAQLTYAAPGVEQSPNGQGWGGTTEAGTVARDDVEQQLADLVPDGDRLVPFLVAGLDVHAHGLELYALATQIDLADEAAAASFRLADGTLPGDGEIALATDVADQLGVDVGDDVETSLSTLGGVGAEGESVAVRVSGLLDGAQPSSTAALLPATGQLVGPDELTPDAEQTTPHWFVAGESPVTWDDVLAFNEVGAVVTSRDVLLNPPPDEAVPYFGGMPETSTSDLVQQWSPFVAVVLVILLEAVLLIGPTFAVGARRSARSLALIAAAGGTARVQRATVLATGVVIGAVSAGAATVLGVGASAAFVAAGTDHVPVVPWVPMLGTLLVGVGISTVAAWLPARRASRADVVAVLAGRRGDVAHRRGPSVAGAALGVAGFAGALAAGFAAQPLLLAGGVIVGEIGLVLACGGIVALLGRVAGRLPLSWRFALRDAARNRGRTAPALAAVLIAVAGAAAGLVYSSSQAAFDTRAQYLGAAPGALTVTLAGTTGAAGLTDQDLDRIRDAVEEVAPAAGELHPVTTLRDVQGSVATSAWVEPPPDHRFTSGMGIELGSVVGPVVDDGGLLELLGVPEPERAREVLAEGRAVVMAGDRWDDGAAHLTVHSWDTETEDDVAHRTVTVPATGVGDPLGPTVTGLPVLPPGLADEVGVATAVTGVVSMPDDPLTRAELQTLNATLGEEFGVDEWDMCRVCATAGEDVQDYGAPQWLSTLFIVGGAGILALAAAWIAAALAATESRPDLATLAAVGAAPTTRKRIVAAQAGTIVVIGSVLGALSGVALGAAFVLFQRYRPDVADVRWTVEVPWPALGAMVVVLPLLAVLAAWLVTRSRLVMTRRLAG